jgi:DNA-binding CsgD family transcriptional regulator
MRGSRAGRFAGDAVQIAAACEGQRAFGRSMLERLAQPVPYDSAILIPQPLDAQGPVAVNRGDHHRVLYQTLRAERARLVAGMEKGSLAIQRQQFYLDTEVFSSSERRNLPFYAEIVRPQGISSQICARIGFRGSVYALLFLCRHGRSHGFRAGDLETLAPLLPSLGMGYAALASASSVVSEQLSPGEQQLVAYIAKGLRNQDIAAILNRSPNTVRNQISRIFEKLGVSNRAELAALSPRP